MSTFESIRDKCTLWYRQSKNKYETCGMVASDLVITLLKQKKIPYQNVTHRLKDETSFLDKCCNGKYTDPISEITDVCGVRIIGYTTTDVDAISKIIEKEFNIDWANSINKSSQLNSDQVGYLSVHYVASFSARRLKLAEYAQFQNIKFEVQIRTILQHAWAEVEHDRSYKFSGELPSEIKRRFYLVAGALELMDREFSRLSSEIDAYAKQVNDATRKGNLEVAIDSTSLSEYLSIKLGDAISIKNSFNGFDKEIVVELQKFGVNSLNKLDKMITNDVLDYAHKAKTKPRNYLGLLRDIMIINDPEKYLDSVWQHDWFFTNSSELDRLEKLNPNVGKIRDFFLYD